MYNRRSRRQYTNGRQMDFHCNYGRNNFQRSEMPYPVDMLNIWDVEPQVGWHDGGFNSHWDWTNNAESPSWPNEHTNNGIQNNSNYGQRKQKNTFWKGKAKSKVLPGNASENTANKKPNPSVKDNVNVEANTQTTIYDNINPQLLKCHICNKSMNNGSSFLKHLSEQSHANMMKNLARSYNCTSNKMKQEFKKVKLECTSKSNSRPKSSHYYSYCLLCDMYAEDGAIHRNTLGHRRLKQYQNPSCNVCHCVFSRRIDLDKHKLSATHMGKLQDGNGTIILAKVEAMEKSNEINNNPDDTLYKKNDNQEVAVVVKKEVIIKEEKEDPISDIHTNHRDSNGGPNFNRNQNTNQRASGNRNNYGRRYSNNDRAIWQELFHSSQPANGGYVQNGPAFANDIVDLTNDWHNGLQKDWSENGFASQMGIRSNQKYQPSGYYNNAGELIQPRKRFHPYRNVPKKHTKTTVKKKSENPNKTQSNQTKDTIPKSQYEDINPQLLQCHICNISSCEGRSFEAHLSGKSHLDMVRRTEQNYVFTVETMRMEIKLNNMERACANNTPNGFYYCAMCDIFAADGFTHRSSNGHRDLKNYIYPPCELCDVELPSRIAWDKHKLTVEHLKALQESWPKIVDSPISSTIDGQVQTGERNKENNDNAQKSSVDNQAAVVPMEVDRDEKKPIPYITILDFREGDNMSHVTPEMIPAYRSDRAVGMSFVTELSCSLCNKLLDFQDTAEVHLRTWKHHQLFVKRLQPQAQRSNKKPKDTTDDQQRETNADNPGNDQNIPIVKEL